MHKFKVTRQVIFRVVVLVFLVLIIISSVITLQDEDLSPSSRINTAMQGFLALSLTLISAYPIIKELFTLNKVPTDEDFVHASAELALAKTHLEKQQYDKAIISATKAITTLPRQAEGYRIRARAYEGAGKITSAIDDYNKAEEQEPGYPMLHNFRASLYQQRGDYEKAKEDFRQAIALMPDLPSAIQQLAILYFNHKEYNLAEKYFLEYINHPRVPDGDKAFAREQLERLGNFRKRHQEYELEDNAIRLSRLQDNSANADSNSTTDNVNQSKADSSKSSDGKQA